MTVYDQPAAIFDVDRTLVKDTSMERLFLPYLVRRRYLRTSDLARYLAFLARNLGEIKDGLIQTNKYHLKDKDPDQLQTLAAECFQQKIIHRISSQGRRRVQEHREQGHLIVLLTGTLEPLAFQLKQEIGAHVVLAARLAVENGALSGTLSNPRPYGEEKARLVKKLPSTHNVDLARSYAYGDHYSDVAMLAAVGNPFAVNPDMGLTIAAYKRGWPIVRFE